MEQQAIGYPGGLFAFPNLRKSRPARRMAKL